MNITILLNFMNGKFLRVTFFLHDVVFLIFYLEVYVESNAYYAIMLFIQALILYVKKIDANDVLLYGPSA